MTIRRGEEWGRLETLLSDVGAIGSDGEAHEAVNRDPSTPMGLCGRGDLARTLGLSGPCASLIAGTSVRVLPIDLGLATVDGHTRRFAVHCIARPRWLLRGPIVAVMNAQFIGEWDVAPRSHPNDGRLDAVVVDAAMRVGDRLKARRRLIHGMHVPHPHIAIESVTGPRTFEFPNPVMVHLDGAPWRSTRSLKIDVVPDGASCVIAAPSDAE